MYKYSIAIILSLLGIMIIYFSILTNNRFSESIIMNNQNHKEPKAQKIDYKFEIHGKKLNDQYHWLRDPNWPKVTSSEILSYLNEENQYAEDFFQDKEILRKKIFEELKDRIELNDISEPVRKGDYIYLKKMYEDKEYPIYFRKRVGKSFEEEEMILDVNKLSYGKSFTNVTNIAVSPSQELLAYNVDFDGSENYFLHIKNLSTEENLPDIIENSTGNIVWHEKLNGFFYTKYNENWRSDKLFFHFLGSDPSEDIILLHEKDILNSVRIKASSSREYLFVSSSGHDSSEVYYIDMSDDNLKLNLAVKRKEKIFYDFNHNGDYFYIHTNDKGDNFRIARVNKNFLDESNWEDFYPISKSKYIDSFDVTKNYLIVTNTILGLPKIEIIRFSDNERKLVNLEDESFTATAYSTNFEDDDIRISYSSLKRPQTTFLYDYLSNSYSVLKERKIPSGFNPDEYQVERVWADNDGVKVPVSLFYKKDLFKKDGSNPLYLYGYGSYGIAMKPNFRITAVTLANRGFVFAIAHIRGGDDLGFKWYEDAKFLTKKRTFEDFIACAKYLIENKYTSKGDIAIEGGSAGGMLIGNAINSNPELFRVAIAHVPFVDVLNTMLDESLPLTPSEYKEWGNPHEKEYFDYILSYCPYSNVKSQIYPHIYVTAGLTDPRVGYWEAAKWVAKLRDMKKDDNFILLKTNMEAGHQGSSGRFNYIKEVADDYVFILSKFGIEN